MAIKARPYLLLYILPHATSCILSEYELCLLASCPLTLSPLGPPLSLALPGRLLAPVPVTKSQTEFSGIEILLLLTVKGGVCD